MSNICVLGASNIDLISYVPRLPVMGETIHGTHFRMGFGGKGANQAVMAAKLGALVCLITKLGKDMFGENTLKNLQSVGVNTEHVFFSEQASTGVAPICVDNTGNNSIVIVTGANDEITSDELISAVHTIQNAKVLVCQLEIPLETNLQALRMAKQAGVTTICNPAPAKSELPSELYINCDLICPNESETEQLTGITVKKISDAEQAARVLVERGAKSALITMGSRGALYLSQDEGFYQPAPMVEVVDTTGAGDAFVGSLAHYLSLNFSVREAVRKAVMIASISVQRPGTQSSFPLLKDLPIDL